jgi:hypothetical protein
MKSKSYTILFNYIKIKHLHGVKSVQDKVAERYTLENIAPDVSLRLNT